MHRRPFPAYQGWHSLALIALGARREIIRGPVGETTVQKVT